MIGSFFILGLGMAAAAVSLFGEVFNVACFKAPKSKKLGLTGGNKWEKLKCE